MNVRISLPRGGGVPNAKGKLEGGGKKVYPVWGLFAGGGGWVKGGGKGEKPRKN